MCVSRSIDGLARCSRSPTPVWVGVTRRCPAAAISGCIFFHAHPADHAPWQTRKVDPMMFLVAPRLIVKTPSGQVYVARKFRDSHSGTHRRCEPQMCDCTSGNLEIPGSLVLLAPRNDVGDSGWR